MKYCNNFELLNVLVTNETNFILLKKYSHAVIIKNSGISNNFILLSFPSCSFHSFIFDIFTGRFVWKTYQKCQREREREGGEYLTRFLWKYLPFFIGCRITRFDCERLVLASKFHEESHYNRRIFGYIRGCSGVTDGTPGNCIGDITHEPVWKAVRSAPPRINWSTMPAAEKRGGKGSRRNNEAEVSI